MGSPRLAQKNQAKNTPRRIGQRILRVIGYSAEHEHRTADERERMPKRALGTSLPLGARGLNFFHSQRDALKIIQIQRQ